MKPIIKHSETDRRQQKRACCGSFCRVWVWQRSYATRADVLYPPDSSLCTTGTVKAPALNCEFDNVPTQREQTYCIHQTLHYVQSCTVKAPALNCEFDNVPTQREQTYCIHQTLHYVQQALSRQQLLTRHQLLTAYYIPDILTYIQSAGWTYELCDTADDQLISNVVGQFNRLLHALLPPSSSASQTLTSQTPCALPQHSALLSDSNFLTRMLYRNTY